MGEDVSSQSHQKSHHSSNSKKCAYVAQRLRSNLANIRSKNSVSKYLEENVRNNPPSESFSKIRRQIKAYRTDIQKNVDYLQKRLGVSIGNTSSANTKWSNFSTAAMKLQEVNELLTQGIDRNRNSYDIFGVDDSCTTSVELHSTRSYPNCSVQGIGYRKSKSEIVLTCYPCMNFPTSSNIGNNVSESFQQCCTPEINAEVLSNDIRMINSTEFLICENIMLQRTMPITRCDLKRMIGEERMCRYCRATMNDLAELLCTRSSPCSECQAKNKFSCSKLMLSKQAQTQQKDECCCDSSGASAIPYTLRALDSEEESCPFICGKCMQPRMHPPCPCTNIKSEVIQTEKDKPKWNLDNSNDKPKKKPQAKKKIKKIKKKHVQIINKKKKKVKKVAKPKKVKKKENKQTKIPKKTKKKVPKKEFQMPKVKPRDSIPLYAFKHPLSHRSLDMCSSNCKNNCTNCSLDLNQNSSSFSPIANTNLPCIKCNAGLLNRAHIMQCKLNSLEASLVQAKMAATSYEVRHMVKKSEPNSFNLHKQQLDEVNENEEN